MNTRNRNRLVLVLIFVMFFIPLLAAVLLQPERFGDDPVNTVNRGELVQPPVPLPPGTVTGVVGTADTEALAGRWVLLHLLPSDCGEACRSVVTDLRQIHIGTGRHRDDVALLLIGDEAQGAMTADIYDALALGTVTDDRFTAAIDDALRASGVAANALEAQRPGTTFVVDPEGNLMLRYAPGYPREDLNKDLRKLLKWSGR